MKLIYRRAAGGELAVHRFDLRGGSRRKIRQGEPHACGDNSCENPAGPIHRALVYPQRETRSGCIVKNKTGANPSKVAPVQKKVGGRFVIRKRTWPAPV